MDWEPRSSSRRDVLTSLPVTQYVLLFPAGLGTAGLEAWFPRQNNSFRKHVSSPFEIQTTAAARGPASNKRSHHCDRDIWSWSLGGGAVITVGEERRMFGTQLIPHNIRIPLGTVSPILVVSNENSSQPEKHTVTRASGISVWVWPLGKPPRPVQVLAEVEEGNSECNLQS